MSTPPAPAIEDPEVRRLATASAILSAGFETAGDGWDGSPFAWIKRWPSSRTRGKIGEDLVAAWLAGRRFTVARSPDSDADRVVEGKRVEVKLSTRWKNGGYKFQQIRDQDYEVLICLGLCPFDAHCWAVPKSEVLRRWRDGAAGISSQHGGAAGTDTAWLSFQHADPPAWLAPFGGSLRNGLASISKITGFAPPAVDEEE